MTKLQKVYRAVAIFGISASAYRVIPTLGYFDMFVIGGAVGIGVISILEDFFKEWEA